MQPECVRGELAQSSISSSEAAWTCSADGRLCRTDWEILRPLSLAFVKLRSLGDRKLGFKRMLAEIPNSGIIIWPAPPADVEKKSSRAPPSLFFGRSALSSFGSPTDAETSWRKPATRGPSRASRNHPDPQTVPTLRRKSGETAQWLLPR